MIQPRFTFNIDVCVATWILQHLLYFLILYILDRIFPAMILEMTFMEPLIRLLWEFSGTLAWRVLGVLRSAFLAHSWHSLVRLLNSLLLGALRLSWRYQQPLELIGFGLVVCEMVVYHPLNCIAS